MKFTKLFMAAFAAMALASSCSKEAEALSPDSSIAPGDALITLNLKGNGVTTYSTILLENAILNGGAKLFNETTGAEIVMTDPKVTATGSKGEFRATVTADKLIPEVGQTEIKAVLYVYLNATPVDAVTGTNAMAKHENAIVTQNIERNLVTGAPAGIRAKFGLKPGLINASSADLKMAQRAIARVQAVNKTDATAKELSIEGFEISFDKVNLTHGKMYAGIGNQGSAEAGAAPHSYTLLHDGLERNTEWTNSWETVAYMYPSTLVKVTVKASAAMGGGSREASFTPKANMNYSINITPSSEDGSFDFKVEIAGWDNAETSEDMDADFSEVPPVEPIELNATYNVDGVEVKSGMLEVTPKTTNTFSINLNDLVTVNGLGEGVVLMGDSEVLTRAAVNGIVNIDNTEGGVLTVEHGAIYNSAGLKFNLKVTAVPTTGDPKELLVPVTILPTAVLPEGFLIDMGDAGTFAAINTQGTLAADIALFNKVNASAQSGSFTDKFVNYFKASSTNYSEVVGKTFVDHAASVGACPKGFKRPSNADFKLLIANTFNHTSGGGATFTTTNPTQYNVRVRNVMESITDGANIVVATDRKVGSFDTGLTDGPASNKSYRIFEYNGTSMANIITGSGDGTSIYGGLFTVEGNVGFNGSNSATMYTVADGKPTNMQVRCIKDVDATHVIW